MPPDPVARARRSRARLPWLAAAIILLCSGCATGHLVDRARRWERAIAYEKATIANGRLTVAYVAAETNQFGQRLDTRRRTAALQLAELAQGSTVDEIRVERLADDAPLVGTPVHLHIEPEHAGEPRLFAPDSEGGAVFLHPAALTQVWIAPWVYPLLPLAAVYDAVAVPVLLVFAPAVIIPGD